MEWRYENDLIKTAEKHGYKSWQKLLVDEYAKLQSTRLTGEIFGRTGPWASTTLRKLGVKLRPRGGKVYTKWQGKNIRCPQCDVKIVSVMGLCRSCYEGNRQKIMRKNKHETDFDYDHAVGY